MGEKRLIIPNLTIEYEGIFDVKDFFALIDDWFKHHGYDKNEVKHVERTREKGKYIDYEILPFKEVGDYAQYEMDIRIEVKNMKEVTVKKNGKKFKLNKGSIVLTNDVFLMTDLEEQWESHAFLFFLRTLFDKFIHKRYTDRYISGLTKDTQELHTEIKSFLNLQKMTNPS